MHVYLTKVFAWLATVVCATVCARGAFLIAKNAPRLFTILILFSLNWAILIPYYSEPNPSELLAGFAGFLLVYVGVLLRREAVSPLQAEAGASEKLLPAANLKELVSEEQIAVRLLIVLIAPSVIGLSFPSHSSPAFLKLEFTSTIVSTLITLIGLYAVCSGVRSYLGNKKGWKSLALIAILYSVIEVIFTVTFLLHPNQGVQVADYWRTAPVPPMTEPFLIMYGLLKLVFTAMFLFLLIRGNRPDAPSMWDEVVKFVYLIIVILTLGLIHPHYEPD
ncbi:MAG TPA: hypothetical protein VI636_15255 [Candidatus Angelobacter sp.]